MGCIHDMAYLNYKNTFFHILLITIVLFVTYLFTFGNIYTKSNYICEITGTTKTKTSYFHAFDTFSYQISNMEKYLSLKYPKSIRHKWIWLSSTDYNILGKAISNDDSNQSTILLDCVPFLKSQFNDLTDDEKDIIYDLLQLSSSEYTDTQKKQMYEEFENIVSKDQLYFFIQKHKP
jgi:hypothetical protein